MICLCALSLSNCEMIVVLAGLLSAVEAQFQSLIDLTKFGEDGQRVIEFASLANGEAVGVCSTNKPSGNDLTFCAPVSGASLSQYIFQKPNTSWSDTNLLAGKISSFIANLCLIGDSGGVTPNAECQDLTKQFVCRMLYAPCDPDVTPPFPKPICGDFCAKLSKCVTYSTCKKAFESLLTCVPPELPIGWHSALAGPSSGTFAGKPYYWNDTYPNVTQWEKPVVSKPPLVSGDPTVCSAAYKLSSFVKPPKFAHVAGCTLIRSSAHECARRGYLRLYGNSTDVVIDPSEFAFRVQPSNTSVEDARVPGMFFRFMSLTANMRLPDMSDGKTAFGEPLATDPLVSPIISCNYNESIQIITLTFNLHGGAAVAGGSTFRVDISIANHDRSVQIGNYSHVVPAGTMKYSLNIQNIPFGGKWPAASTHLIVPALMIPTAFFSSWNRLSTSSFDEFLTRIDDATFKLRLCTADRLKLVTVDTKVIEAKGTWYESLFKTNTILDGCLKFPTPVSFDMFQSYLDYDPDISLVYTGSLYEAYDATETMQPIAMSGVIVPVSLPNAGSGASAVAGIIVAVVVVVVAIVLVIAFVASGYAARVRMAMSRAPAE